MTFKSRPVNPVIHTTYFKLVDRTTDTFERFVVLCREYLSGHEGMTEFTLGRRAVEMQRPVNDQAFDVVMQQGFAGKDDYLRYRQHPRHEEWITLAGSMALERRVFDSYLLEPAEPTKPRRKC